MTNKPTHRAYIVVEPRAGSDKKPSWIDVGAVWQHKNGGGGFDLVIPLGLSVGGRIVCMPPKVEDTAADPVA